MCVVLEPFVGALSYYPDPSTVMAERPKHAGVPTSSRAEHHSVCRIYHCLQFGQRDPTAATAALRCLTGGLITSTPPSIRSSSRAVGSTASGAAPSPSNIHTRGSIPGFSQRTSTSRTAHLRTIDECVSLGVQALSMSIPVSVTAVLRSVIPATPYSSVNARTASSSRSTPTTSSAPAAARTHLRVSDRSPNSRRPRGEVISSTSCLAVPCCHHTQGDCGRRVCAASWIGQALDPVLEHC